MKERIQRIIGDKAISASKLAELLQVQPSGISHILSGRNNPSMDFMVKFLSVFPDVNPEWFVLGNGPIYRTTTREARTLPRLSDTDMVSNEYEPVEIKAVESGSRTTKSVSDEYSGNIEERVAAYRHTIAQPNVNQTPVSKTSSSNPLSDFSERRRITRVMVFYSDHTVESFDYSDSL